MKNTEGLIPWQPGQSGNPKGRPKGARSKATKMRHALDVLVAQEVPPKLLEQLPPHIAEILPEDVTFAEVAALRVALTAVGGSPKEALAAAMTILQAQQKPDRNAPLEAPKPPVLPSTEERRQAIAEQLGVGTEGKPEGEPVQ